MPRYLAFICWTLGVLFVGDIAFLIAEVIQLSVPESAARYVVVGANFVAGAITAFFLVILVAFFRRARWSFVWLQTITLVTALLVIGSAVIEEEPLRYSSAIEAVELVRSWLEAFACVALFFALKRTDARRWFDGQSLTHN